MQCFRQRALKVHAERLAEAYGRACPGLENNVDRTPFTYVVSNTNKLPFGQRRKGVDMKAARNVLLVILVALSLRSFTAQAGSGPIIALFDMEDRGSKLDKEVLVNLIEYLGARLAEGGYKVVPRDQIRQRLLESKTESYKSCFDQSCQIELGRELAAQKTLATKILRIGDTCQVTSVMYDLKKATTEMAATAEADCEVNKLLVAVKKIAERLCAPLQKASKQADAKLAESTKSWQRTRNPKRPSGSARRRPGKWS